MRETMPALSLHKLASPLLYSSGSYTRAWRRQAAKRPLALVLVYHRVVADHAAANGHYGIERGVSAEVFEAQLRFMLKHFVPVQASAVLDETSTPLRFAVTLDDGYEDNYRVAAPILQKLGICATFFVVSGYVGTDRIFWWEQLAAMMRSTTVLQLDTQAVLPELVRPEGLPPVLPLQTDPLREQAYERLCRAIRTDAHAALPGHLERLSVALGVKPREEGRQLEAVIHTTLPHQHPAMASDHQHLFGSRLPKGERCLPRSVHVEGVVGVLQHGHAITVEPQMGDNLGKQFWAAGLA